MSVAKRSSAAQATDARIPDPQMLANMRQEFRRPEGKPLFAVALVALVATSDFASAQQTSGGR